MQRMARCAREQLPGLARDTPQLRCSCATHTTEACIIVTHCGDTHDLHPQVFNAAQLAVFGVKCEVCIEGACSRVPSSETDGEWRRLAVTFESVNFRYATTILRGVAGEHLRSHAFVPRRVGERQIGSLGLGWVNGGKGAQGWVDTTYLDEQLRLGRGDKGSIFVTVRRK